MAASTLRDLLSTTDALFNKSDELNGELLRLVRAIQARRAPAEAAEIVRLAAAGIDASSLQLLAAPPSAAGGSAAPASAPLTALEQALADCRAASAAMCVPAAARALSFFSRVPRPTRARAPADRPPSHTHTCTLCAPRQPIHPSSAVTRRGALCQLEPAREPQRRGGRARRAHSKGAGAGHGKQGAAAGRAASGVGVRPLGGWGGSRHCRAQRQRAVLSWGRGAPAS